jgi:hypothetical protein
MSAWLLERPCAGAWHTGTRLSKIKIANRCPPLALPRANHAMKLRRTIHGLRVDPAKVLEACAGMMGTLA